MVISASDPAVVRLVVDTLLSGKLVIMPCDTIYGILGICPDTEERISRLKGRASEKRYICLVADTDALTELSSSEIETDLLDMLPGPLTLVVRGSGGSTVAVRVPADERLLSILKEVGKPVFSTSVNRADSPPLWRADEILMSFGEEVDLVVNGGDLPGGEPSTILDLTVHPYRLLRQGACIVPNRFLGL